MYRWSAGWIVAAPADNALCHCMNSIAIKRIKDTCAGTL